MGRIIQILAGGGLGSVSKTQFSRNDQPSKASLAAEYFALLQQVLNQSPANRLTFLLAALGRKCFLRSLILYSLEESKSGKSSFRQLSRWDSPKSQNRGKRKGHQTLKSPILELRQDLCNRLHSGGEITPLDLNLNETPIGRDLPDGNDYRLFPVKVAGTLYGAVLFFPENDRFSPEDIPNLELAAQTIGFVLGGADFELPGQFQIFAEATLDGFLLADQEGNILDVNSRYCQMTGYSKEEIRALNLADLEVEFSPGSWRERLQRLKQSGNEQFEIQHRKKNGTVLELEASVSLMTIGAAPRVLYFVRDLSSIKRALRQAEANSDKFRSIFENANDAIMLHEVKALRFPGRLREVNSECTRLLGYSREELVNMEIRQLVSPESFRQAPKLLKQIFSQKRFAFEINVIHKSGEKIPVEILAAPVEIAGEKLMVSVLRDLRPQKKAQAVLMESEMRHRLVFENSPVPLWEEDFSELEKYLDKLKEQGIKDIRGYFREHPAELRKCASLIKILDVNTATLSLLEARSKKQLLGNLDKLFAPDSYPTFLEEIAAIFRGQQNFQVESETQTLTGKRKIILLRVSRLNQPELGTRGAGVLVSTTDITELKRAERGLLRKIEELKAVQELGATISSSVVLEDVLERVVEGVRSAVSPDLILLYLRDGELLRLQKAYVGQAPLDLKKATIHHVGECLCGLAVSTGAAIFSEDICADPRCSLPECKEAGVRSFVALPLVSQDRILGVLGIASLEPGKFLEVKPFLQALSAEIGIGLQNAIFFDQLRRHEQELEQRVLERTAQLQAMNRELNEFAYVVSHDLKAPLRGIAQLAQWIHQDYFDKLGEEGKKYLELMQTRVYRMYDLIDGILQYSRVGRLKEKLEPIDTKKLVAEIVDMLEPPSRISVEIQQEMPVVQGDRTLLEQVFQNLIENAIKFNDKSDGKIWIGATEKGDFFEFYVRDNGPGLKKEYFDKIFQIFQTLQPKDQQEGTGIGLSLVKKIVEGCGGKVWVESEVGSGSTFYFLYPMAREKKS